MIIYPAIDIQDGKCVRLAKGDLHDPTVYSSDPVDQAKRWEAKGAQFIHVVDLDGAYKGYPENLEIVEELVKTVKVPIQFGGGVRNEATAETLLDIGVGRIVLGTVAVSDLSLVNQLVDSFGDMIAVGIDSRNGTVSIKGWTENASVTDIEMAKGLEQLGVKRAIFTDIDRDGVLAGPNIDSIKRLMEAVKMGVIASGGVANLKDIESLATLKPQPEGVIIGRALYTGDVKLEEAIMLCEELR